MKPQRHILKSALMWTWIVVLVDLFFRAGVILYAYHRSPTWPWDRFTRNVGDPDVFIRIDEIILAAAIVLAVVALVQSRSRLQRVLPWGTLIACTFLWLTSTIGGFLPGCFWLVGR
jgi:hypothetical protein